METSSGPCVVCSSTSTLRCSGCVDGPFYCCKQHQKSDWKSSHCNTCASKYIEKVIDPTSPYGVTYKAKIGIPIGTVLFRKKPILVFPRILNENDLMSSPLVKEYGAAAAAMGESIPGENLVPCLDCYELIPYGQIMMTPDPNGKIPLRLHKCPKCEWPIHNMDCGEAHGEECEILKTNGVKWEPYRVMADGFFMIGILRAVLLKKNQNPVYENTLMKMKTLDYKNYQMNRILQRMIPQFIFNKCKLDAVISKAELEKLGKIIHSNFLSVTHRPSKRSKFAVVIFGDSCNPNGRVLTHSCMANFGVTFDHKTLEGTFSARRDINAGETLTLNYDPMLGDSPLRGSKSRLDWLTNNGIECQCLRCTTVDENGTMYNAIRCQNRRCQGQGQPSYMVPVRQTPDDCDYVCLVCDKRIPHSAMMMVQQKVMIVMQTYKDDVGYLRPCLREFIPENVHPNHFLALRILQQICTLAYKMIMPLEQYKLHTNRGPGSEAIVVVHPTKFIYLPLLENFEDYLNAIELLSGVPKRSSGAFHFVIIYSCLRLNQIGKEIILSGSCDDQFDPSELSKYTDQLITINTDIDFALGRCKSDPVSNNEEFKAYEDLIEIYIKYFFGAIEGIWIKEGSWDTLAPIYKILFGKAKFNNEKLLVF